MGWHDCLSPFTITDERWRTPQWEPRITLLLRSFYKQVSVQGGMIDMIILVVMIMQIWSFIIIFVVIIVDVDLIIRLRQELWLVELGGDHVWDADRLPSLLFGNTPGDIQKGQLYMNQFDNTNTITNTNTNTKNWLPTLLFGNSSGDLQKGQH